MGFFFFFFFFFSTSAPCLSSSLLPSSFVICLSSCTRRGQFLSKALMYHCFRVFRHIGEYFSLDLFYRVFSVCTRNPVRAAGMVQLLSDCRFAQCILNVHQSCYNVVLVVMWLVLCKSKTDAISVLVQCTPYDHASLYSVILLEATSVGCMLGGHSIYAA